MLKILLQVCKKRKTSDSRIWIFNSFDQSKVICQNQIYNPLAHQLFWFLDLLHQVVKWNHRAHFSKLWSNSDWDLKVCAYCSFKVSTSDHSPTHWIIGFKLLPFGYQVYWIQIFNGALKYMDWRFMLQQITIRDVCGLWDSELSLITIIRFTMNKAF